MTQHTPGPWAVWKNAGVSAPYTIEGDGCTLAEVYWSERFDNPDSEALANARLIAAAPRMLEVIRALVSSPAMVDNDEPMMAEARAILRDVEGK